MPGYKCMGFTTVERQRIYKLKQFHEAETEAEHGFSEKVVW
jgi:hypothetical protein